MLAPGTALPVPGAFSFSWDAELLLIQFSFTAFGLAFPSSVLVGLSCGSSPLPQAPLPFARGFFLSSSSVSLPRPAMDFVNAYCLITAAVLFIVAMIIGM